MHIANTTLLVSAPSTGHILYSTFLLPSTTKNTVTTLDNIFDKKITMAEFECSTNRKVVQDKQAEKETRKNVVLQAGKKPSLKEL